MPSSGKGNGQKAKPKAKGKAAKMRQPQTKTLSAKSSKQRIAPLRNTGNVFSIESPAEVPVSRYIGKALGLSSLRLLNLPTGLTARRLFVVSNTGHSATVAITMYTDGVAGTASYDVPLYSASPSSGGPTSGRAMKAGIRIVNTTSKLKAGGRLIVLHSDARIALPAAPSAMTLAQMTTFFDGIATHPKSLQLSGNELGTGVSFSCSVVDQVKYEGFRQWVGVDTVDSFASHVFTWPGVAVLDDYERPMSTIFFLQEIPVDSQDYTITFCHSVYTRWTQNTVPNISERTIPVVSDKAMGMLQNKGR